MRFGIPVLFFNSFHDILNNLFPPPQYTTYFPHYTIYSPPPVHNLFSPTTQFISPQYTTLHPLAYTKLSAILTYTQTLELFHSQRSYFLCLIKMEVCRHYFGATNTLIFFFFWKGVGSLICCSKCRLLPVAPSAL